jgi:hypothetical protein
LHSVTVSDPTSGWFSKGVIYIFIVLFVQNHNKLNKLPTILEEDESDRGDGYKGPTFRCSVQNVYSVVPQFDQQKRDIVTSMGWGGTLSIPLISKLSVKHMVWLLGMVDEVRQAIVLGPDKVFKFNESDVAKVLFFFYQ